MPESARVPIPRLKTCISLFEVRTDSPSLAKVTTKLGAGLWPTVACEFKRAGFLEGEAIGTSLLIGLNPTGDADNSAVGLLVPHFQKTAPFESRLQCSPSGDTQDPTVFFVGLG